MAARFAVGFLRRDSGAITPWRGSLTASMEDGPSPRAVELRASVPGPAATVCLLAGTGLMLLGGRDTAVFRAVLQLYGLALLNLAFLDCILVWDGARPLSTAAFRRTQHTVYELSADVFGSLRHCVQSRADAAWLTAVVGLGIAVRAYSLAQPI